MRFEDERYVRLYTRDTTTWLMLPWQARCLLPLILRKVDRAGVLELGDDGVEALAVVTQTPLEVVAPGLEALLRRKVLLQEGTTLVWPRFLEAQECAQSDRARQRTARERARDLAVDRVTNRDEVVTERDETITHRDDPSHAVTGGHAASRHVTPAVPAVPNQPEDQDAVSNPPDQDSAKPTSSAAATQPPLLDVGKPTPSPDERDVFDHWLALWRANVGGNRAPSLSAPRAKAIRASLNKGYTVGEIKQAIDAIWADDWHFRNKQLDVTLVCRDEVTLDKWLAVATSRTSGVIRTVMPVRLGSGAPPPLDDDNFAADDFDAPVNGALQSRVIS